MDSIHLLITLLFITVSAIPRPQSNPSDNNEQPVHMGKGFMLCQDIPEHLKTLTEWDVMSSANTDQFVYKKDQCKDLNESKLETEYSAISLKPDFFQNFNFTIAKPESPDLTLDATEEEDKLIKELLNLVVDKTLQALSQDPNGWDVTLGEIFFLYHLQKECLQNYQFKFLTTFAQVFLFKLNPRLQAPSLNVNLAKRTCMSCDPII